ncbi:MAG: glycoside hydrolase family 97 protein [Bacteroidaceae bacterium]|nr:glycoside hydrolase family 97 protein [Bacteroidaceae bacterium]
MKRLAILLLFAGYTLLCAAAQLVPTHLTSPDGRLKVFVNTRDGQLSYTVFEGELTDRNIYALDNQIALFLDEMGKNRYSLSKPKLIREHLVAPNYRQAEFDVAYNQLIVKNKNGVNVEFRAYNEGVAYRFFTTSYDKKSWRVKDELAEFNFGDDRKAYIPYSTNEKNPKATAFQNVYTEAPLSQTRAIEAFLPVTIDCEKAKVTILESDGEDYPGMFLLPCGDRAKHVMRLGKPVEGLRGDFAHYPKTFDHYPWRMQKYVTGVEDFIAQGQGNRTFPWRILAIAHEDKEMPMNNMVYALASPSRVSDTSWIRPGHVAWDWWNDWGLSSVPFEAGINTETYRHYIDFAASHHLEYVILDEGWYNPKSGDMLRTIPDIDLPQLVEYARQKGVRLILWTVFNVLDDQLEAACKQYADMGIAGFKVDFLDRNDQEAVQMTYRIAEACARHHLVLDYHGIYAPTGIQRTWPNVINFEAVFGMEEVKWTKHDERDMPLYDVSFPFIRGQAGYVDFTPGGMRNATRQDYQPVYSNPMTMGTRCHQLAHYVVHESPLTMLADSPSAYEKEPECAHFIASLPPMYESMDIIDGRLGEYIIALRTDKAGNYYLAGETNWDARDMEIPLSFLPEGEWQAVLFADGANAHRVATDYRKEQMQVNHAPLLRIHMAPGGGFAMQIRKGLD